MKKIWIAIPLITACGSIAQGPGDDAGVNKDGSIPSGALICQMTGSSGSTYYGCDSQWRKPSDPFVDCTACATTNSCNIGDLEAGEYGTGSCSHAP